MTSARALPIEEKFSALIEALVLGRVRCGGAPAAAVDMVVVGVYSGSRECCRYVRARRCGRRQA